MGRPFSSLKREVMNYNIENRASKFISKDKSVPSPKHPSTVEQTKILKEEYGITIEDVSKKDEKLNKHLRNIYVVSEGPALSSESTKALPLNRITDWSDMQYGYREPEVIPAGKISLKRALELLSKYHEGGGKWTYDNLAKHYNLNVKFVETLVDRYRVLELHLPTQEVKEKSKDKPKMYAKKVQMQLALQNIHKLGLISTKNKQKSILPPPPIEEIKPT